MLYYLIVYNMNKPIYILFLFASFLVANESPDWYNPIEDKVIAEDCSNPDDQSYSCAEFPINLIEHVSDVDGDDLTITISDNSEGVSFSEEDMILSVTLTENFNTLESGPITVEITADDGQSDSSTTSFTLTVTPVNDIPVWSGIPNQSIAEDCIDDDSCNAFPIFLSDYIEDEEDDVLDYEIGDIVFNPNNYNEQATFNIVDGQMSLESLTEYFFGEIIVNVIA